MFDPGEHPRSAAGKRPGERGALPEGARMRSGQSGDEQIERGASDLLPQVRARAEGGPEGDGERLGVSDDLLPQVRAHAGVAEPRWELPGRLARTGSVPVTVLPALAAGSFAAGVALAEIIHRCRGGARGRSGALLWPREGDRRASRGADRLEIVGSRSFLLDVHLLARGARERR
jgi:hypothetical protein